MIKIFIDTNFFLNAILDRDEGVSKSVLVFLIEREIKLYICDITISNIAYILRKEFSTTEIKEILLDIEREFKIIGANNKIVKSALKSNFQDIEDAVQYFCAKSFDCDLIISNNKKDFQNSDIEIIDSNSFFNKYVKG